MSSFEERKERLKKIRNKYLRLHKILLDWDRASYERENGVVSSGKFLELLLGDPRFSWLRNISTLIVRIDESFDLDDGMSSEMLDGFYKEMTGLSDDSDEFQEYKEKLAHGIKENPDAGVVYSEIRELLK